MQPILISFGDFFIAWYGLLVAAGLFTGTAVAVWLARKSDLDPNVIFDLLLISTVGLLAGARLFYIFTVWDEFLKDPLAHIFTRSGFVFLGGLVGSVGGGIVYVKMKGIPIVRIGDICAPCIPLGHALGRIGCHQTGCCHGGVVPHGWESCGIHVPPAIQTLSDGSERIVGGYAYFEQLDAGLIAHGAATSLPVWPVQLMSSAANLLLAAALLWLFFRRRWVGQVFFTYFISYSILRFGLEFFRGDSSRGVYDVAGIDFSFSQFVGALVFIGAIVCYYFGRQNKLPGQDREFPPEVSLSAQQAARERELKRNEKAARREEKYAPDDRERRDNKRNIVAHTASESTPGFVRPTPPPKSREQVEKTLSERSRKAEQASKKGNAKKRPMGKKRR